MSGYILSILGIVVVGIIVDVIIPSGAINKFIKSVYGIFVVLIIINPVIKLFKNANDFNLNYNNYQTNVNLLNYINNLKIDALKKEIIKQLKDKGLEGVEVEIAFSLNSNNLQLNSCTVNLKNLSSLNNQVHNNRYEIIVEVVKEITNLDKEVIIFNEWKRK